MREGVNYSGLSSRKDNRGGGIFARLIRACVPSTREKCLEEGVVESGELLLVSYLKRNGDEQFLSVLLFRE